MPLPHSGTAPLPPPGAAAGISVREPDRLNLAGLFLRSLLARRAADPAAAGAFAGFRGCVAVDAGGMGVTLRAVDGGIEIAPGLDAAAEAVVSGSLSALLRLCRGGSVLDAWWRGEVRASGKAWRLLPLLRLFRTNRKDPS